jgi:FAD synthase
MEAPLSQVKTIRELYPTLSEQELREAEANLLRYFAIAASICEEQKSSSVDTFPALNTMEERSKFLKN